jgi:phosphopantothenoylcysteine decarboxylase/phosphopantothenate--cysteine ligase
MADDLLTNVLLTARCPVVFAPAMHTEMWEHAATRANVATLRSRGAIVIEPATGRLTGADTGKGRLPEPDEIFRVLRRVLRRGNQPPDLAGRHVVVTAGGTREPIDPVRFIGNRSSGKQGYALAAAAVSRGAEVDLVAANATAPAPLGVELVEVESALELRDAVEKLARGADAVVMAAAPADFRPAGRSPYKIKKHEGTGASPIDLVENPDILAGLVAERGPAALPVLVGFAAETGDDEGGVLEHGRAKLARKGCDLLVVNDVSGGAVFGADDNSAVILSADGAERAVAHGSKVDLAHVIWDEVSRRLENRAN